MNELTTYIIDKLDSITNAVIMKDPDDHKIIEAAGMVQAYEDVLKKIEEIRKKEL